MKIIVAGSRSFSDYAMLCKVIDKYLSFRTDVADGRDDVEIVSGCARGADTLGQRYAEQNGFKLSLFPAKWSIHGKSAGYRRNREMALYADVLIAFWDGNSLGTGHMINRAQELRLEIVVHKF